MGVFSFVCNLIITVVLGMFNLWYQRNFPPRVMVWSSAGFASFGPFSSRQQDTVCPVCTCLEWLMPSPVCKDSPTFFRDLMSWILQISSLACGIYANNLCWSWWGLIVQIIPVGQKGKINTLNRTGENKGGGQCFCSVVVIKGNIK